MRDLSQEFSTVSFSWRHFKSEPSSKPPACNPATRPASSVLLVGRNISWGPSLLNLIMKIGPEPVFVSPLRATSKIVKEGAYSLVLLGSCVPREQRTQVVSNLVGSVASLFYAYPVETGCWWLPALLLGKDCHGAPAFRTTDFLRELERLLQTGNTRARLNSL
jgi:hypothetical protein